MATIEYHHIGHDPRRGAIAIWSVDERLDLHEERREDRAVDAAFLDWSHDNCFRDVKARALGRVELDRKAGSIQISDPDLARSTRWLCRLLDRLERRYPDTRWYLFGSGLRGESSEDFLLREAA